MRSTWSRPVLVLFALVVFGAAQSPAASAPASPAPGVTGVLKVDGKTIPLKHVAAYSYDSLEPGKKNVSLLLSDRPVSAKAWQENFVWRPGEPLVPGLFDGAWKSLHMEGALQGVSVTLKPDKTVMLASILVGGQDKMFDLMGSDLVAEIKSAAPRLVGSIRAASDPFDAGGHKLTLQVSVDAPVVSLPK
jgi:hypothetical protein